jgi:hypothetical protein
MSYLSLSIARSCDEVGGCRPIRNDLKLSSARWGTFYVRKSLQHSQRLDLGKGIGAAEIEPDSFPLFTRGWVYQGRFLPQRVLHIGEGELFWECNRRFGCECKAMDQLEEIRPPAGCDPLFWKFS